MRCQTACCHSTMTMRITSGDGCTTSPHGWRVPNHLRLLRAPYTRAWHDHRSLDWRKSACCSPGAVAAQRARGSKNTHGCVPRVYTYSHISHGRRGPRSSEAAEGRERVFRAKSFETHRARIPGVGRGLKVHVPAHLQVTVWWGDCGVRVFYGYSPLTVSVIRNAADRPQAADAVSPFQLHYLLLTT